MGDPRKPRKKYNTPRHPWVKERIDSEKILVNGYGLKNKKEVQKAQSRIKQIREQVKNLIRDRDLPQAQKEQEQLIVRLVKLGICKPGIAVEGLLDLDIKDVLNRRLQTVVVKNKLAITSKQSRQMITHGHVIVNGNKVTIPSYMVGVEDNIEVRGDSGFARLDHPEREKLIKKDKGERILAKKKEKEAKPKVEVKKQPTVEKKAEAPKEEKKEEAKVEEKKVETPKVEAPKEEKK